MTFHWPSFQVPLASTVASPARGSGGLLTAALPFISNPVVLAVVGIGALGFILFNKEEDQGNGTETAPNGLEPLDEPYDDDHSTVGATVIEPFKTVETTVEGTVHSTVVEPYDTKEPDGSYYEQHQTEADNDVATKKEMIRQAMSELGKRSAAARAKKRAPD